MTNNMDVEELLKLYALKKENPEKYKEFMAGIKDIMKDLMTVAKEILEEIE